ncbi:MAG: hypothetical protein RLZZ450_7148 [Pseudomonadota bacterium]|jgi:transposase
MSKPFDWVTRADLVHRIVTLDQQGLSRRAITRTLGVSRNTVRVILVAHRVERDTPHQALSPPSTRAPRSTKLDGFSARITELLDKYPDITAQRVFEILGDEGYGGKYGIIKKHVRAVRPKPKPAPSLTTPDFGPGEMGECDWSPYPFKFTAAPPLTLQAFSYVLVHSRRKFYHLFPRSDLHALMDGHVLTFERFKGAARQCKYDSQKPVVLRWEGAQPIYNPRFIAFATHYEFRPVAARGYPNFKPRVERSFWEFETSFLNGRSFRDPGDLHAQLSDWLDRIADHRSKKIGSPLERFAREQPHLVPLPRHPYDTARVVYRVCSIDGFVDWDGNRYAIPYDHVTDILPLRITRNELFAYAPDLTCVARHQLAPRGQALKLDPSGYHPSPRRNSTSLDVERLAETFAALGEGGQRFFQLLCSLPPRRWTFQARRILGLRARYDSADLDMALAHAARYGAFDCDAIERILGVRARPRSLDEYVAEHTAQRLAQSVEDGSDPQDLHIYDDLPIVGQVTAQMAPHSQDSLPCPDARTTPPLDPPIATFSTASADISPSSD